MTQVSDDVWRVEAPHVLAALQRRSTDFAACEDAVQDALLAASLQWGAGNVPDRPRGWLVRVASRRLIDAQRGQAARQHREQLVAADPVLGALAGQVTHDLGRAEIKDDTLHMLILCAHPALSPASQVALTLRAVAGLTTTQIAAAFLVPETTMAQRIVRAKATIARAGADVPTPRIEDLPGRLHAVRHVLYITFNEGYTSSSGETLMDTDVAAEAIRLTDILHQRLPNDTETAGLLALMLLTHARSRARTDANGEIVPLAQQDRTRWDRDLIDQGTQLVERALPSGPVGPFQLQAVIVAVHAEAANAIDTDWRQIVELYRMLDKIAPSWVVSLNLAVAIGMADGAEAGLKALHPLLAEPVQQHNHRPHAAHAHLLELAGRPNAAVAAFRRAATLTNSIPEQRYLNRRAESLAVSPTPSPKSA